MRQSASEDFLEMGEKTSVENGRVERPVCLGGTEERGPRLMWSGSHVLYMFPPFYALIWVPAPPLIIKMVRQGLNGTVVASEG